MLIGEVLVVLLICFVLVRIVHGRGTVHHADYALIARLEHQLLDGPYEHKGCQACYEQTHLKAVAAINAARARSAYADPHIGSPEVRYQLASDAGLDWYRAVSGIGGEFTPRRTIETGFGKMAYYALRPDLRVKHLDGGTFK